MRHKKVIDFNWMYIYACGTSINYANKQIDWTKDELICISSFSQIFLADANLMNVADKETL